MGPVEPCRQKGTKMAKTQSTVQRLLSVMLAFVLACSLSVGYSLTALGSPAYADDVSAQATTDIGSLKFNAPGKQTNFSGVVKVDGQNTVPSAEVYNSSIKYDGGKLAAGTDYTVSYNWSGVNAEGIGTAVATLTGIGNYSGTATINLEIEAYELTVNVGSKATTLSATELRKLAEDSTDNTANATFQYGTTVVVVPAKQYVTYNALIEKCGGKEASNGQSAAFATIKSAASDGFSATYTLEQAVNGQWYPAQTKTAYSTDGAVAAPPVLALAFATAPISSTAGSAALTLANDLATGKATPEQTPRAFVGATESDYKAGNIAGNRFATGISTVTVDTDLSALNLVIDQQVYTGSPIEPLSGKDGGIKVFNGYWLNTGKDFTVTYTNNVNAGTATALLTAAPDSGWTGSATIDFKIAPWTLTVKSDTQTIFTFTRADVEKWAAEATDNTQPACYQYARGEKAEAFYVPAKKYVTYDTICEKVGGSNWTSVTADCDGFKYTLSAEAAKKGYYFPAQTTTANLTDGAQLVPAVLALEWMSAQYSTSTAGAAIQQAMQNTPDTTPRNFVGISMEDYQAGANMGGNRFVTNPDTVVVDATYKSQSITDNSKSAWYYEVVNSVVDLGLIQGYTNADGQFSGKFGPNDRLTRAQVATILWRASGAEEPATYPKNETKFTDVKDHEWYTAGINWAVANGVFNGRDGSSTFDINDYVDREMLVTVLANYASKIMKEDTTAVDGTLAEGYPDWNRVDAWAQPATKWAIDKGIITGVVQSDGKSLIDPFNTATRAQMAKMMLMTLQSNLS